MMEWRRVALHGVMAGDYRVGKVYLDGCTLYQLWRGERLLKTCNDFAECKDIAELDARGLFPC